MTRAYFSYVLFSPNHRCEMLHLEVPTARWFTAHFKLSIFIKSNGESISRAQQHWLSSQIPNLVPSPGLPLPETLSTLQTAYSYDEEVKAYNITSPRKLMLQGLIFFLYSRYKSTTGIKDFTEKRPIYFSCRWLPAGWDAAHSSSQLDFLESH